MPWTALGEPSLGLGALRAVLEADGIPCRVWHLNLFMLRFVRAPTYLSLANTFALNDFVFSGVLDDEPTPLQRRRLRAKTKEMLSLGLVDRHWFGGIDGVTRQILKLRDEVVPAWLAECADRIARADASLVGFTCMFDQTIAAAALAKLVKERAPQKLVAMGGYALRPPTGQTVLRAFPWVDAVCIGEGEPVIGPLVEASAGRRELATVPNLLLHDAGGVRATPAAAPVDMDAMPPPSFHDYFADLEALARDDSVEIKVDTLPYETSRGCWWGQVKHCVFCGIADEDMAFRARSASTVLADLDALSRAHGIDSFRFSDYILPQAYYKTLLPELAARRRKYRLACEMKANSSPERFSLLARAGFTEVQPGIESFSTDALRKMDKGVSAAQNVQTLLLGKRHGVHIHYNLLWGFPDDEPDAYRRMAAELPKLAHLDPPLARTPIQVTRYAPVQADPERFGIPTARYEPGYEVIFSRRFLHRSGFDLNDYCYYFERPFQNRPALAPVYRRIVETVDSWKAIHVRREPRLEFDLDADGMTVFDSRETEAGVEHRLSPAAASVCVEAAFTPLTLRQLAARVGERMAGDEVGAAVDELDAHGLLFHDGDRVIPLALPRAVPSGTAAITTERAWAVA
jgi:ribosomal peptide maturation radical SAM protein 1